MKIGVSVDRPRVLDQFEIMLAMAEQRIKYSLYLVSTGEHHSLIKLLFGKLEDYA